MIDFGISLSRSICCLLDMDDTKSLHSSSSCNALVLPLMLLLLLRCPHHFPPVLKNSSLMKNFFDLIRISPKAWVRS